MRFTYRPSKCTASPSLRNIGPSPYFFEHLSKQFFRQAHHIRIGTPDLSHDLKPALDRISPGFIERMDGIDILLKPGLSDRFHPHIGPGASGKHASCFPVPDRKAGINGMFFSRKLRAIYVKLRPGFAVFRDRVRDARRSCPLPEQNVRALGSTALRAFPIA